MSSFRSAAPLRACIPMSAVPPSPAKATTVTSSFPSCLRARLIPDAQIADVSKRTWRLGTLNALNGFVSLKMRWDEAGMEAAVSGPRTFIAIRTLMAPPGGGPALPDHELDAPVGHVPTAEAREEPEDGDLVAVVEGIPRLDVRRAAHAEGHGPVVHPN